MAYIKMLTDDWIKVQANPIQRDTEKHAAKAKHLLTPHPTHSYVFAAKLPNGNLVKLDGHTRALLWKRGDVKAPLQVHVAVIPVESMDQAEELYKDFDSKDALETAKDKVSGAFGKIKFDPESGLLASGSLTTALRICVGVKYGLTVKGSLSGATHRSQMVLKLDIYEMVKEFCYELYALDAYGLPQAKVGSGIIAAYILSYRRYGAKVTPFWSGVFGNTGSKVGGEMDAIQALCEMMMQQKSRGGGAGVRSNIDICGRALMAVEKFLKDDTFTTIPRPLDTADYLINYQKPQERLIKAGRP